jgi:hypothetical protein
MLADSLHAKALSPILWREYRSLYVPLLFQVQQTLPGSLSKACENIRRIVLGFGPLKTAGTDPSFGRQRAGGGRTGGSGVGSRGLFAWGVTAGTVSHDFHSTYQRSKDDGKSTDVIWQIYVLEHVDVKPTIAAEARLSHLQSGSRYPLQHLHEGRQKKHWQWPGT